MQHLAVDHKTIIFHGLPLSSILSLIIIISPQMPLPLLAVTFWDEPFQIVADIIKKLPFFWTIFVFLVSRF